MNIKDAIQMGKGLAGTLGELFEREFVKQVDAAREPVADAARFLWANQVSGDHAAYLAMLTPPEILAAAGSRQDIVCSKIADAARFLYIERGFAQYSLTSQSYADYVVMIDRERAPVADAAWHLFDSVSFPQGWLKRSTGKMILSELECVNRGTSLLAELQKPNACHFEVVASDSPWFNWGKSLADALANELKNEALEKTVTCEGRVVGLMDIEGRGASGERIKVTNIQMRKINSIGLSYEDVAKHLGKKFGIVQIVSVSVGSVNHG